MKDPAAYQCSFAMLVGVGSAYWCRKCTSVDNILNLDGTTFPDGSESEIASIGKQDIRPAAIRITVPNLSKRNPGSSSSTPAAELESEMLRKRKESAMAFQRKHQPHLVESTKRK